MYLKEKPAENLSHQERLQPNGNNSLSTNLFHRKMKPRTTITTFPVWACPHRWGNCSLRNTTTLGAQLLLTSSSQDNPSLAGRYKGTRRGVKWVLIIFSSCWHCKVLFVLDLFGAVTSYLLAVFQKAAGRQWLRCILVLLELLFQRQGSPKQLYKNSNELFTGRTV